jgi:hypothetical protein
MVAGHQFTSFSAIPLIDDSEIMVKTTVKEREDR